MRKILFKPPGTAIIVALLVSMFLVFAAVLVTVAPTSSGMHPVRATTMAAEAPTVAVLATYDVALASARLIGESVYFDSMIACVSAVLLAGSAVYVTKRGLSIGNRTQALMLR